MKIVNISELRVRKESNIRKKKEYKEPENDALDYLKAEFDSTLAEVQRNKKGEKENGNTK